MFYSEQNNKSGAYSLPEGVFGNIQQKDIVNIEDDLKCDKIFSFSPLGVKLGSNLKDVEEINNESIEVGIKNTLY